MPKTEVMMTIEAARRIAKRPKFGYPISELIEARNLLRDAAEYNELRSRLPADASVVCNRQCDDGDIECDDCEGDGVSEPSRDGYGIEYHCRSCRGIGVVDCPTCEGTGRLKLRELRPGDTALDVRFWLEAARGWKEVCDG